MQGAGGDSNFRVILHHHMYADRDDLMSTHSMWYTKKQTFTFELKRTIQNSHGSAMSQYNTPTPVVIVECTVLET